MRASWRDWLRIRRLVPVTVVVAAVVLVVLEVAGFLGPRVFEPAVVLMLGLLALDSLVERVGILEKLEDKIDSARRGSGLDDRSTLRADLLFAGARDVAISGVTLLNILTDRRDAFEDILGRGVRLRVLLLDPSSHGWEAWNDAVEDEPSQAHMDTAIAVLRRIKRQVPSADLEVRYAPYLLPVCLVIVDAPFPHGHLVAEMLFPGIAGYQRPHTTIVRGDDPRWFDFFCKRFEQTWERSVAVQL